MTTVVLIWGKLFDGISETLTGPSEILVEDKRISQIERSVGRPPGVQVIDLSDRTVSPGFIDTHVRLTMDAANLAAQTLESSAAKALKGLSIAQQYMSYGFTTLRDLGNIDPDWPTVDLRNALNAGLIEGPRLIIAAHIISATAGRQMTKIGGDPPRLLARFTLRRPVWSWKLEVAQRPPVVIRDEAKQLQPGVRLVDGPRVGNRAQSVGRIHSAVPC
jgi:imidazolonepropionase-like amidohydrolase